MSKDIYSKVSSLNAITQQQYINFCYYILSLTCELILATEGENEFGGETCWSKLISDTTIGISVVEHSG